MKKLIKNYLEKLRENDKKGFSLVELIIVMAIMAVLVGVVASQVLPYLEKSRISKDQENLASLQMDITAAISTAGNAINAGTQDLTEAGLNAICSGAADEFKGYRGGSIPSWSDLNFKSKKARTGTKVCVETTNDGAITVYIAKADGTKVDASKLSVSSSNANASPAPAAT